MSHVRDVLFTVSRVSLTGVSIDSSPTRFHCVSTLLTPFSVVFHLRNTNNIMGTTIVAKLGELSALANTDMSSCRSCMLISAVTRGQSTSLLQHRGSANSGYRRRKYLRPSGCVGALLGAQGALLLQQDVDQLTINPSIQPKTDRLVCEHFKIPCLT
jgi:hypothetical protein